MMVNVPYASDDNSKNGIKNFFIVTTQACPRYNLTSPAKSHKKLPSVSVKFAQKQSVSEMETD